MDMPQNGFLIDGMKVQVRPKEIASPRKKEPSRQTGPIQTGKVQNQTTSPAPYHQTPQGEVNPPASASNAGKSSIVDQLLKNSNIGETLPQSESKRSQKSPITARPESGNSNANQDDFQHAGEPARIGLASKSRNASPTVANSSHKKKGQLLISTLSDEYTEERIAIPNELNSAYDQLSPLDKKSQKGSPAASNKSNSSSKGKNSPQRESEHSYHGSNGSVHEKLVVDDTDAAEDSAGTKDSLDPNFLLAELYHHNMKDILGFSQFKKKTLNNLEQNMKERGILPSAGNLHSIIDSLQKLPKAQIKQILKEKQAEQSPEKKLFGINHYKQTQSPNKMQSLSPIFRAQGFKSKLVASEQYKSGQMKKFTDAFKALKDANGGKSPKAKQCASVRSHENPDKRSPHNREPFKQHRVHKESVVVQNTMPVQTSILSPNSSAYNGAGVTSLSSSKGMTPNYTGSAGRTQVNAHSREYRYKTLSKWPQLPLQMNKEDRRKEELEGKRMSLQQKESTQKLRKGPFPTCTNQSSHYVRLGTTAATPLNNMHNKKKLEIFQGHEDIKETQIDDCESPIYQALRREASEDQQSTVKGEELIQVHPAETEKEMIDQGHQNEETHSTNEAHEGELGSNAGEVDAQRSHPAFPSLNPDILLEKINEVKKADQVKEQLKNVALYENQHPQSNSVFQLDQHLFESVKQGLEDQHGKRNPGRNKKLPSTLIHKQSYLVFSDMPMMISQSKFNIASMKNKRFDIVMHSGNMESHLYSRTLQNEGDANGDVKGPFRSFQRNQSNSMMSQYIYGKVNPSKLNAGHKDSQRESAVRTHHRTSSNSLAQGPGGADNSQMASARETFYIAEQAGKDLQEVKMAMEISNQASDPRLQQQQKAEQQASRACQQDLSEPTTRQAVAPMPTTTSTSVKNYGNINNRTRVGRPTVVQLRASKEVIVDPMSPRSSDNGGLASQLLKPTIDTNQCQITKPSLIIRQEGSKTISPTASLSPIRRPQFHLETINSTSAAAQANNSIIKLNNVSRPKKGELYWTSWQSQKNDIARARKTETNMKPTAPLQEKQMMETVQACCGGNTPKRYMDSEGKSQELISSSREKLLSQEMQRSVNQAKNILERNFGGSSSPQRSQKKSKVKDWQQLENVLQILQAKGQILNRSLNWKAKLKCKNHDSKFNIHDKSKRHITKLEPEIVAPPNLRYESPLQSLVTKINRKIAIPKQLNLDLQLQLQSLDNNNSLMVESRTALTGSIPSPQQLQKPTLQNMNTQVNTQFNSNQNNSNVASTFRLNASLTLQPQPQVSSATQIGCADYVDSQQQLRPAPLLEGKKQVHLPQAFKKLEADSSRTRTAQKIAHRDKESCDSIASSNESNLKMNIINIHNIPTSQLPNQPPIATHDYSCQVSQTKMPGIGTRLHKIETEYEFEDKSNSNKSPTKTNETSQEPNPKLPQVGFQNRDIQVVKYQISPDQKKSDSKSRGGRDNGQQSIPASRSPSQCIESVIQNPKTVVYSELSQQYKSPNEAHEHSDHDRKDDSGREIEVIEDSEQESDTVVTAKRMEEKNAQERSQATMKVIERVQMKQYMKIESQGEEEQVRSPHFQKVKRLMAAKKKKYKHMKQQRANNQSLNTTLPQLIQTQTPMHCSSAIQSPNLILPASPLHRSLQYETFHHQDHLAALAGRDMVVGGNRMSIKQTSRQSANQAAPSMDRNRGPIRFEQNDRFNNYNNTLNVSEIWVKPFELNNMDKIERYRRTRQYGLHISQQIKNTKSINVKDSFQIEKPSEPASRQYFSIPIGPPAAPSLLPSAASREQSFKSGHAAVAQQRQTTIKAIKQLKESMKFNALDYQICEIKGQKYQSPTIMQKKINSRNVNDAFQEHPSHSRTKSFLPYPTSPTISNIHTASPSRVLLNQEPSSSLADAHKNISALERKNSDLDCTQNSNYLAIGVGTMGKLDKYC